MFDQSFSTENYLAIFNKENRKGHVSFDDMPETYRRIVCEINTLKNRVSEITKKKKKERTEEEIADFEKLKSSIKIKQEERNKELMAELTVYADKANVKDFTFPINNYEEDDKQIFTIDTSDWVNFYAIKNLQRSLRGLFNVKQANKHQIISNIRLLLDTTRPIYLIRTDISSFFESIPQVRLLKKINNNNLVNNKTRGMIQGILNEYNKQKNIDIIKAECGVPRGIGISSYLSEIYMHDIDEKIKNREEVIFYVRYVDDIFMILAGLPKKQSISQYYRDLKALFLKYDLELKNNDPTEGKCKLIDFYSSSAKQDITYLGYKITITKVKKMITKFNMSDAKFDRIKRKIDAAFTHFENLSAINIKQAERDLFDSLNLISGNYRLTKSKAMVKAGLYYGSDLLTDYTDLDNLTTYLTTKSVNPYSEVLKGSPDRKSYIDKIEMKILAIDFNKRWHEHTMFKFNSKRLKEISNWL